MAVQVGIAWSRGGYAQPLEEVVSYNLCAWDGLNRWVEEMVGMAKAA